VSHLLANGRQRAWCRRHVEDDGFRSPVDAALRRWHRNHYIWSAELTEKYGLIPFAGNMLVGLFTLLPLAGFEMTLHTVDITVEALAAIAYLGVVVTLILWLYLLKIVPARVAASV
jgi:drug/metabolite transporter (DMT)-like permease